MALFGMECGFSQPHFANRHEIGGLTPSGGGWPEASPLSLSNDGSSQTPPPGNSLSPDAPGASDNHHFRTNISIKFSGFGPDLGAGCKTARGVSCVPRM